MFVKNFKLKTFVQKALCNFREIVDFATVHPTREMQKLAVQKTVEYISQHMSNALGFYTSRQVFDLALASVAVDGHFLEFGVYEGGTARYIASHKSCKKLHGFDSFEGLPTDWTGNSLASGTFSRGGKPPRLPSNITLHIGWFDKTLPAWVNSHPGPIAFLHVDCDLYESTRVIFELLGPRIQNGTIIVFDEYFGYPNWENHEFKAFREFVEKTNIEYEYLAYAKWQVAVRIKSR